MSAPLLKETAAHAMRWLRWQLGDESDRPMPWELFADGLERQRDAARNVADQYISKANAHDSEILGYRETIKALEEKLALSQEAVRILDGKLTQVEEQLAAKDGYPEQPADDGGPARDITLRDWFAGVALPQAMENWERWNRKENDLGAPMSRIATLASEACYEQADAMLASRNGKGGA